MEILNFIACMLFLWTCDTMNSNEFGALFEAKDSFEGKTCNEADLIFRKELPRSKIDCLVECVNHADCVSIFYVQQTGNCSGCEVRYGIVAYPTELMFGSQYYEEQICPTGWTVIENSCYYLTQDANTFTDGVNECLSTNSHPVIMRNENENNNIKAFLNSMTFTNGEFAFYTAFKSTTEGVWITHDSTSSLNGSFDDWAPGEPSNDATENCLVYFLIMGLQWADSPCNGVYRMICEQDI